MRLPINRCCVLAGQFGKIDQGFFSFWIHSYRARRPLKCIGSNGTGHQVRDCMHMRDSLPLIRRQIEKPAADMPRIVNCSGGLTQSASLRPLSAWCEARFGQHEIAAEKQPRQFDVPWLILDSSLAHRDWQWQPQTTLEKTWDGIAEHAEKNLRRVEVTVS